MVPWIHSICCVVSGVCQELNLKTPHIKHIFTTENHVLVLLWIFSCKAAQITSPLVGISGTVKTGWVVLNISTRGSDCLLSCIKAARQAVCIHWQQSCCHAHTPGKTLSSISAKNTAFPMHLWENWYKKHSTDSSMTIWAYPNYCGWYYVCSYWL